MCTGNDQWSSGSSLARLHEGEVKRNKMILSWGMTGSGKPELGPWRALTIAPMWATCSCGSEIYASDEKGVHVERWCQLPTRARQDGLGLSLGRQ